MTLGGSVPIRNGFSLDYSFKESVKSLLPICDKVIICDCDSTDGTREFIDDWSSKEPKLVVANFPWTNPIGTTDWFCEFINYSRQHLSTDHFIHLDGDECLHEDDYEKIVESAKRRSVLFFKRLNFWKDPWHLIPEGQCCGTKVLRMAANNQPIPSDYPWGPATDTVKQAVDSNIRVFHTGFLRKREEFFKKAREVQRIWVNGFDPRLEQAEREGGNWMENPCTVPWVNELKEYHGTHPKVIKPWLRERGYSV